MWWYKCPPDCDRIFFQETVSCFSSHPVLAAWQNITSPIFPSLIIFFAWWTPLKKFIIWPAIKITLFSLQVSTITLQSSYDKAIGFSQNTCFPFLAANTTGSRCKLLGVATTTQSTSSRSTNSSNDEQFFALSSLETFSPFSGSKTAVTFASFIFSNERAKSAPK